MQVSSKTVPQQKKGLEKQNQSNEIISSKNISSNNSKINENSSSVKSGEKNETSQYLKVLSRVENLLLQKKLPDAAIEGFVGAVKNQMDSLGEEDRQIILKLTESTELDLKNLDDLPNMIKENLRNDEEVAKLFKFLKLPKFAELMQTEVKNVSKTYSAQPSQYKSEIKSSEIKILDIPKTDLQTSPVELKQQTQNQINQKV